MNLRVVLDAYRKAWLKGDVENAKLHHATLLTYYLNIEESDKKRFILMIDCTTSLDIMKRATKPMTDHDKEWYGRHILNIPLEKAKRMTDEEIQKAVSRTLTQL